MAIQEFRNTMMKQLGNNIKCVVLLATCLIARVGNSFYGEGISAIYCEIEHSACDEICKNRKRKTYT